MYKRMTTCAEGCSCMAMRAESETVLAGEVCATAKCGINGIRSSQELARINFPVQVYTSGFCPNEALLRGTMFPELVL